MTDDLKPGWQMDAAIAERVFGWKDLWRVDWPELVHWCGTPPGGTDRAVPAYSTDPGAAWLVAEWLKARDVDVMIYNERAEKIPSPDGWIWEVELTREGSGCVLEQWATFPEAICRAALQWAERWER